MSVVRYKLTLRAAAGSLSLFKLGALIGSLLIASAAPLYGWQANAQANTVVTEQEAAQLATAVFSGLERTGDIRKLGRKIYDPAPFEAPCEFLFLMPEAICAQLRQDERREYVYTSVTTIWQIFEHQMSLPVPPLLSGKVKAPNEADFFPDEVRHLLPPTKTVEPETLEGFRNQLLAGEDLEKALLEHRLRHDHLNQPSYRKNMKLLEDTLQLSPESVLLFRQTDKRRLLHYLLLR